MRTMQRIALLILMVIGPAVMAARAESPEYRAYLMAHFGPEEKLYYAVSDDARNWRALNDGKPVFDAGVRLRDPFINRVKGKFHLVHTKGWDYPEIYHWESADLIHWTGGPIRVVEDSRVRAWAPEFFSEPKADVFHVYWASLHNDHNTMHHVTTRDWTDITPARSAVWYDLGIHDIDLTIVEHQGVYYGFHKPGGVDDRMGNRLSTVTSLDPAQDSFAKAGPGEDVFPGQSKPIEGPEVIKLIDQDKWYIYADPFQSPMEAWETTDLAHFSKIPVKVPEGSKHCSMTAITESEFKALQARYPTAATEAAAQN